MVEEYVNSEEGQRAGERKTRADKGTRRSKKGVEVRVPDSESSDEEDRGRNGDNEPRRGVELGMGENEPGNLPVPGGDGETDIDLGPPPKKAKHSE